MAGKVVNIKVCGSHQLYHGLIAYCPVIRHYSYTHRYMAFRKNEPEYKQIDKIADKYLKYMIVLLLLKNC